MSELLVRNAYVIDPLSGIKGDIMDIAIRDGKIVEEVGSGGVVIDGEGCLTLPGDRAHDDDGFPDGGRVH